MSDKLSSPFPISPKVRGCLFAAPSHWELCKQGVAAGTFSRWHDRPRPRGWVRQVPCPRLLQGSLQGREAAWPSPWLAGSPSLPRCTERSNMAMERPPLLARSFPADKGECSPVEIEEDPMGPSWVQKHPVSFSFLVVPCGCGTLVLNQGLNPGPR